MSKKMRKKSLSPRTRAATAAQPAKRKPASAQSRSQSLAAKKGAPPRKTKAASPAKTSPLAEGATAPTFRLQRDGGAEIALSDYKGQKLAIFFYPRANTPGCTREAIDFTRLAGPFADAGTAVLGVSADSLRAQESFRDKHALSVPLLSDATHQMLEAYGAWGEKSMYGRTFLGILRTTVLIGRDGRVARIWRNVRVDGHAEAVLEAARKL